MRRITIEAYPGGLFVQPDSPFNWVFEFAVKCKEYTKGKMITDVRILGKSGAGAEQRSKESRAKQPKEDSRRNSGRPHLLFRLVPSFVLASILFVHVVFPPVNVLCFLVFLLTAPGASGGTKNQEPCGTVGGDADEETRDQTAALWRTGNNHGQGERGSKLGYCSNIYH